VANQTVEVQFTNQRQTGFIQICKETEGGLTGTFTFTSPAFAGTQSVTVVQRRNPARLHAADRGRCRPIAVSEGALPAGSAFVALVAVPAGALVGVNAATPGLRRSTSLAGTQTQQTQIIFRNRPARAFMQICKEDRTRSRRHLQLSRAPAFAAPRA
jgi:hypothetical protein